MALEEVVEITKTDDEMEVVGFFESVAVQLSDDIMATSVPLAVEHVRVSVLELSVASMFDLDDVTFSSSSSLLDKYFNGARFLV